MPVDLELPGLGRGQVGIAAGKHPCELLDRSQGLGLVEVWFDLVRVGLDDVRLGPQPAAGESDVEQLTPGSPT